MRQEVTTTRLWISRVRKVAAWLIIPVLASAFIAHQVIISKYILPWPYGAPRPRNLDMLLLWRNGSLLLAVFCVLVSLPRWQSIAGLIGIIMFFYFFGSI